MLTVFAQKVSILLERRSATCSVRDNGIKAIVKHGGDVLAGKLSRFRPVSCVSLKCAATVLSFRHPHLNAIFVEDADGCTIQFREGHVCDASSMQGHSRAELPFCGKNFPNLVEEEMIVDRRLKLLELRNSHELEQS